MAESGSWESIRGNGLFSTSALLDRFNITGQQRVQLENRQRLENKVIGKFPSGPVVLRDQIPLNEGALKKIVHGMTTEEFYRLLNGKTFFWARKERLQRLLNGRQYRNRDHDVLTVDTEALLNRHRANVWLSRTNSGAFYGSGRKGPDTFKRIEDYPFEELRKKQRDDAIVEVAIDYAVPDIADATLKVESWKGGNRVSEIWACS